MPYSLFCDLGTTCGYAIGDRDILLSGDWELKPTRFESWAMRLIFFRRHLEELHKTHPIEHVAYEEVRAHAGVDAAHCYGALMGVLQVFCLEKGIPYETVPVGTLKKFWTGKGNASKEQMIEACFERTGQTPGSHNEADAIAGWHWLMAKFPTEEAVPTVEGSAVHVSESMQFESATIHSASKK